MTICDVTLPKLKSIKRGSTLDLTYSLPLATGNLFSVVESQIRLADDTLIESLVVTLLTPTATHRLWRLYASPAQTALWPTGTLLCDIKNITAALDVSYTDTFILPIEEAITA